MLVFSQHYQVIPVYYFLRRAAAKHLFYLCSFTAPYPLNFSRPVACQSPGKGGAAPVAAGYRFSGIKFSAHLNNARGQEAGAFPENSVFCPGVNYNFTLGF
jgi:hypothetical protein